MSSLEIQNDKIFHCILAIETLFSVSHDILLLSSTRRYKLKLDSWWQKIPVNPKLIKMKYGSQPLTLDINNMDSSWGLLHNVVPKFRYHKTEHEKPQDITFVS